MSCLKKKNSLGPMLSKIESILGIIENLTCLQKWRTRQLVTKVVINRLCTIQSMIEASMVRIWEGEEWRDSMVHVLEGIRVPKTHV